MKKIIITICAFWVIFLVVQYNDSVKDAGVKRYVMQETAALTNQIQPEQSPHLVNITVPFVKVQAF